MEYRGGRGKLSYQIKRWTCSARLSRTFVTMFLSICVLGSSWCVGSACLGAGSRVDKRPSVKETRARQDLLAVTFPTDKDGWASGRWGTILHTSDGGMSWEKQTSGLDYTLISVSFVDAKTGWIVGDGGTILHTKDGGKNWLPQKSPVQSYLMGVHFSTPLKGWAVAERTTILHTADGGKTWNVQFKDEDYILKSISFCDENNGWAVGEYGLIYHTANGGATWEKQAGGFGISEETGELEGGNILFRVIAINPKTAWAVGIDGFITKTVDGGATWQPVGKDVPKVHLFGLAWAGNTVVVGGTGLLLVGSSNGSAFKVADVAPKATYGFIYGIAPRGKTGFVAVGKAGWIYLADEKASQWRLAEKR